MVSVSNQMFEDQNLNEAPCDLAMTTAAALIAPYRKTGMSTLAIREHSHDFVAFFVF
jgi:hypothetical protein